MCVINIGLFDRRGRLKALIDLDEGADPGPVYRRMPLAVEIARLPSPRLNMAKGPPVVAYWVTVKIEGSNAAEFKNKGDATAQFQNSPPRTTNLNMN